MDGQTIQSLLALGVVAGAGLFLGARWYRTYAAARRRKGAGCDSDCGCSPH